ncbi:MAG: hypothetical protein WCI67_21730 [Chloroflexales bacterium]
MPLLKRSIGGEIAAAREAESGASHAANVAQTLRLIARLAHQVSPRDLAMIDDDVQSALAELSVSYGFARLAQAARAWRLDERAAG